MELVLHEDKPKYDLRHKLFFSLIPVAFLVLGFLTYYGFLPNETEAEARKVAIILFVATACVLLSFWAFLPRKYQICEDKIRIVLGGPFSFNIGFSTIKEIRKVTALEMIRGGFDFTTSTKGIVKIVRSKGMYVTISPTNRELFLEELNQAMAYWKKRQSK